MPPKTDTGTDSVTAEAEINGIAASENVVDDAIGIEGIEDAHSALADEADVSAQRVDHEPAIPRRRVPWSRIIAFAVLPALTLLLAAGAGYLKWQDSSARAGDNARLESVNAAKDTTIALLSYRADTVEKDLGAATARLTGSFKHNYQDLISNVVIPGAKQQHISTTATVPAAAAVSATSDHATVLLYVNQTTTIGASPPSDLQSSVRVTMDKVDDRWIMSGFDPV